MARHNEVGKWGEDIACEKLIRDGYAIIKRNWKLHHYEVDIIASKGDRIIFVEVKTRTNDDYDPIAAVDRKKIDRLLRSGIAYVRYFSPNLDPQFDIIGITGNPSDYKIEHIEDAILPPLKAY